MSQASSFEQDPVLVWAFYENRRQMAMNAEPNAGHAALAKLSAYKPNFLTVTQNIDELSFRAGHRFPQLLPLHGSLFEVRCSDQDCDFAFRNQEKAPTVPGLDLPSFDASSPAVPLPHIAAEAVPVCPECRSAKLRPNVVWFGEVLPDNITTYIDAWLDLPPKIDLMLVIGTTRSGYVQDARSRGAAIVYFNKFEHSSEWTEYFAHVPPSEIYTEYVDEGDWIVYGDVSVSLPRLIERALSGV